MIGIGVDLCSISRIKKAIEQNVGFIDRYYTNSEKEYLDNRAKFYYDSAAVMFATKEAVLKAFGLGISHIPLNNISLDHNENKAPTVKLNNKALEYFNNLNAKEIFVSISHEENMAIAFIIII